MIQKQKSKTDLVKVVLFFDLCSSTTMLEDLLRSERQNHWCSMLNDLKIFLRKEQHKLGFEIYKFIGDGWILLFDPDCSGDDLFCFMKKLCKKYDALYKTKVARVLASEVGNVGITFGLDMGTLRRLKMNSHNEYIGRALNVAARLQGAIKDKDDQPQGKVLMTNSVYEHCKQSICGKFKIKSVKRELRNISGGSLFRAKKLNLMKSAD